MTDPVAGEELPSRVVQIECRKKIRFQPGGCSHEPARPLEATKTRV